MGSNVSEIYEIEQARLEEEKRANNAEKVFTSETGGTQILWEYANGMHTPIGDPFPSKGWRETADGTREYVEYYMGWGWMTSDELFAARQTYPRDAP